MRYPAALSTLIDVLKKLPGVGTKSAERYAFHLLDCPENDLQEMANAFSTLRSRLRNCKECGCLVESDNKTCFFCHPTRRDHSVLCVIATAREAYSIEETKEYRGTYHVLGGLLSPLSGKKAHQLPIDPLKARISKNGVREVIIALDSTLEGDATSLFLQRELKELPIHISRLALGLPMGSSLDFVDGGTLALAFAGRRTLETG